MSKTLIITIGTRDVQIERQALTGIANEDAISKIFFENRPEQLIARNGGQFILNYWDQLSKKISFPILKPFMDEIIKTQNVEFDRVFIIATDQPESTGNYYLSDTCHFAEIIKKHMNSSFSRPDYVPFRNIRIVTIKRNVTYLDAMFEEFKLLFLSNNFKNMAESTEIHLLNQGGIDAINTGLMLQLLYNYGEKVKLYNVNERTKLCIQLNFQAQFGYEQEKSRLIHAINRHDYAAVKDMKVSTRISNWCAYAESRLHFDFERARTHLLRMEIDDRFERDYELTEIDTVRSDDRLLTAELYWNMIIKFQQEQYIDFIQRFFRIIEQISKDGAFSVIGFNIIHTDWNKEFVEKYLSMDKNNDLKQHLDTYLVNGEPLDYSEPNIEVFKAILNYGNKDLFDFVTSLTPLARLRNKGIGAHGFSPIGKNQILECVKADGESGFNEILVRLKDYTKAVSNPYERLQKHIKEIIEK